MTENRTQKPTRRTFLKSGVLASSSFAIGNNALGAQSNHPNYLVPVVNHNEIQLKAIFQEPVSNPLMHVGAHQVLGTATDTQRKGFNFHAAELSPNTEYELSLWDGPTRLSDPWPLRTYPDPSAASEHVRLLVFTCAGGHPRMSEGVNSSFQPMATRRALLERGLSFKPAAMIAIGDQVYWDQRTSLEAENQRRRSAARKVYEQAGMLDLSLPAAHVKNEKTLQYVAGGQITPLYGTLLRSTPSYFINDDHDYFENDEATQRFVTLPPYTYQKDFARYVRNRYLPDFLRDDTRSGVFAGDGVEGTNASFGSFRWGTLAEVLMYDCAGHLSLKGAAAGLVPPEVETWLTRRAQDVQMRHSIHVPSHPMGWSAGKWREWYPDVADTGGTGTQTAQMATAGKQFKLTIDKPKFMWQSGWWAQHQRLLEALAAQKNRPAIVMSGDLHATGHARLLQSATLDLSDNPVNTIITGPLGTGTYWPSAARGTAPLIASRLRAENPASIQEKNGFTIVDITPADVRVRLFAWRREENDINEIANLQPYHDVRITRKGLS